MGRADMQMTLQTLFPSAIKHGRSPDCDVTYHTTLRQSECSDTREIYQTQLKATQTSLECTAHDSGFAKENVTRLTRHFRITIATVRIDTIDKCEMR